jgi:class 3 adenylate cyclase/tetratricopeptide (TPR) repeat protein
VADGASGLVTILFTDLVGSTELLARAGDEEAQRIFRAHHDLLAEAAAVHGGQEVKWLGDGLMVAFPSAADAVRCAIAMQQASRRPIQGERLAIRVGLNAGEALREAADYFGTPVVVARRLCDRAEGGQILCTHVVAELLAGRPGFSFSDLAKLDLKGVPDPVAAFEVRYEAAPVTGVPGRMPFVGRDAELRRLAERLAEAGAGRGRLALVAGEPGIGKTRLAEELAEVAHRKGVAVLWGRCIEGEWAPPYAPFVEVLEVLATTAPPEQLVVDLGLGAAPLAHLVPELRQVLPNLPEAVPVQPDEERFRLLDGVAQLLIARSARAPLLLVLDDLHWADKGTIAMLRHVARFAPQQKILVVGTYRDVEVGPGHPLTEALDTLRREADYERVRLEGLEQEAVRELLSAVAEQEVSEALGFAIAKETEGNPFFIREVVRHLIEEGKVYQGQDGRWTSDLPVGELGIPEGVREVIGRRLSRLSEAANRLLAVACGFEAEFQFDIVARVADLDEDDALDGLDEALSAHLAEEAGTPGAYAFSHALIRHTLYGQLSSARRLRLHRRLAEALWAAFGADLSPAWAGEIASQYHRSAGLPGAEKGVEPALVVAAHAEAAGAHDEAARFLLMAMELLPETDPRRPRLLGRLGVALTWALRFEEAIRAAGEAADAITAHEGPEAATEYLSEAAYACSMAGGQRYAWELARRGLAYAGERRDVAWARLVSFDYERRAAEDPQHPGIPVDSPERRQSARILREAHLDPLAPGPMEAVFDSRDDALASTNLIVLVFWAGEYARCVPLLEATALDAEALGRLARAARCWAALGSCQAALGRLKEARQAFTRAQALANRLGHPIFALVYTRESLVQTEDEGWEETAATVGRITGSTDPAVAWVLGGLVANASVAAARLGRPEEALSYLRQALPWLEQAPAWSAMLAPLACHAAETLWLLERLDDVDVIERALREKVITPDFRAPFMVDGRLALARICALTGRHDEARRWLAKARSVLSEQGARPLLAVADYDEALMSVRRGQPGDLDRAGPLLDAARRQFEEIGMTGWIRRAEELHTRLG